ncbi:MAG TPA: tetratricopeptide repeat protein [Haliangiales bacterium]|nr:tetratricopeptide repeat protein [Haliangiales bacterium]
MLGVSEAAELIGVPAARLRYWAQTGLVGPSVREKGRFFYTFEDLVAVKVARELCDAGLPTQRVRKHLEALRRLLPGRPLASVRVVSDGEELVVVDEDGAFQPATGQLVLSFAVRSLLPGEVVPLREPEPETAYGCFLAAAACEDEGDDGRAVRLYERALRLDPSFAAAWTNLGNVHERRGRLGEARLAYEKALALDPEQPEARFNLANLYADLDDTELALSEYRRVAAASPGFADVHYNLGLLLARIGAVAQARTHLERFLELEGTLPWGDAARQLVSML